MAENQPEPRTKKRRGYYKCSTCQHQGIDQTVVYPTVYGLKRHIFSTHLHEKGFTLICGIDGCPVSMKNRRNLSDHVTKYHTGREWIPNSQGDELIATVQPDSNLLPVLDEDTDSQGSDVVSSNVDAEPRCPNQSSHTDGCHSGSGNLPQVPFGNFMYSSDDDSSDEDRDVTTFKHSNSLSNEERQMKAVLSLAKLKANYNLTQVALQAVQKWTEGLLLNVAQTIIGGIKLVNSNQPSTTLTVDDVYELGEGMANPFHGLDSEWMLKKILKDKLGYVEPETVILHESPNEGVRGEAKIHSMQYVPILDVLKLLYTDKKFRSELARGKGHTDGMMTDFSDGLYYRNHPLFTRNPNALQLQLYYDGFEVVNPLGSKIQKHNLGAIYFSILNLDPAYRSTLKSICLTALVVEKDVKHADIGWDVILRRLNADLKELEDGFRLKVAGEELFVQGTIAQWSLDNKAAHSVFGFHDCFHGETTCISRYCHCTSADIQIISAAKECVLRNRQSVDRDVAAMENTGETANGINSRCFIKSQYFHPADAFAADIHHDVLEGLIPGMLKPILQELVGKRLFTIQQFNGRTRNFNYNHEDSNNRPSVITDAKLREDCRSLKQYAAQYWCLLRKMPLLIGDRVPPDDEHWVLLLELISVVDLIMSPKVDEEILSYLEMELLLLFTEFRRLFPNVRLTPKMHYTLHYPRLMREVGPLIRHWVMRYEAKHHFFKRAAVLTGNFINVAKTLATRHQMLQVVHVHQGDMLCDEVVVTHGHPEKVANLQHATEISDLFDDPVVTICDKVTIFGTIYRIGTAVLTSVNADGSVQVGEIRNILVSKTKAVCFVVAMFDVIEYHEHFHSWQIERPSDPEVCVTLHSSLHDHHPVGIHNSFGESSALYANFRYYVRF